MISVIDKLALLGMIWLFLLIMGLMWCSAWKGLDANGTIWMTIALVGLITTPFVLLPCSNN